MTAPEDPSPGPSAAGDAPGPHPDDREPEDWDRGLARERTSLAWTRTAIGFAALGGVVLKANVVTGLIILAMAPLVWQLGRISRSDSPATTLSTVGTTRIRLITLSIVAVSLLSLLVALLGHSVPGALR
jgi:uncharacterized membrane protein YidH (DUF202 family)